MTRVNLAYNPSFRDGLTGYAATSGSTLAITSDYSFYGTGALQVTKSSANNSGVQSTTPIAVVAGLPYAVSAYVRLPNTLPAAEAANLAISVEWRNSLNVVLSTSSSVAYTLDDDEDWARLSGVWTAPMGATVAYIRIAQVIGGTAGAVFLVDAILFEQSSYVGGYLENLTQGEENVIVNRALTHAVPQSFEGLELNADVTINDLVLNTIDEDGVVWICTDINGWWGQSTPEIPDIPRGTEDGSYDVSGRYQARLLTLTGVFFPPSNEALGKARDRLVTATNLVRKGGWLRTNEEPTKAAYVRLSGLPQIQTVNARGRTEFSIGFRAGDPIKYQWNDTDPEGFSNFHLNASSSVAPLVNIGTAEVTGEITLTGPLGAGSTIYNALTDETLTTVQALRGAGIVGSVSSVSVTSNIATLKTTSPSHLNIGDEISVSGVGLPYDTVGSTATVLAASDSFPYTLSYALTSDDQAETPASGQIQLAHNDVLIIDTYNRVVTFNETTTGNRSKIETLTDWIKFAPGVNNIEFYDDVDHLAVTTKSIAGGVATLTAADTHYLIPGESLVVALNTLAALSKKSLTSNVVTLTTVTPHGFSVTDKIDVSSTELSIVDQKSASTTVATLRTVDPHGVSVSDVVLVALPATVAPIQKSLTSNVVTLTTALAHGFSAGDTIVVSLPASATITNKSLTSNQATLTTGAAHNFQVGDSITVALGATASITNKSKSGSSAIITTSAAHGFSVGDSVDISLPASATLTNSRAMGGSAGGYLVTVNTTGDHNFSLGDRITVNIGVTSTGTVTNRSATTSACTLTIGSHGFSVGEKITVSGVTSRYNGTFYITGVTGTTVTYDNAGVTESSTASSGSVLNVTIASYYNGSKIIQTIPSTTSLTYFAWDQDVASTSTATGTSATLTNQTNTDFNGTKTLTSASSTQFAYNY